MKTITLQRDTFQELRTFGKFIADGEIICHSLEDTDRGLYNCMALRDIRAIKVAGKTAIPYGAYILDFQYSPRFKRAMLTINNVPGFDGIRIHAGNTEKDTEGCPITGTYRTVTTVTSSRDAMAKLEKCVLNAGGVVILHIIK